MIKISLKIMKLLVITGIILLSSSMVCASEDSGIVTLRTLSAALTTKTVTAAVSDCNKRGYKVSAAMVGRDGNLLAFSRNPLSGPHTIEVSQRKAYSSATFQAPTSEMLDRLNEGLVHAPKILLIRGGLPVSVGGHFYGAIAVSGAPSEIDEKCAQAGIDVITEQLEFAG